MHWPKRHSDMLSERTRWKSCGLFRSDPTGYRNHTPRMDQATNRIGSDQPTKAPKTHLVSQPRHRLLSFFTVKIGGAGPSGLHWRQCHCGDHKPSYDSGPTIAKLNKGPRQIYKVPKTTCKEVRGEVHTKSLYSLITYQLNNPSSSTFAF